MSFEEKEKELIGRLDEQLKDAAKWEYVIDPDFIVDIGDEIKSLLKDLRDREGFTKEIAQLEQMISVIGYVVRRVYEKFED